MDTELNVKWKTIKLLEESLYNIDFDDDLLDIKPELSLMKE